MNGMDSGNGMYLSYEANRSESADKEIDACHRSRADCSDRAEGTEKRTMKPGRAMQKLRKRGRCGRRICSRCHIWCGWC